MTRNLVITIITGLWLLTYSASGLTLGDPLAQKNKLGNEYFRQGKLEEALKYYKEAQVENPQSPEIFYNLGNVFAQQQKYEEAIKEYETALAKTQSEQLKARTYYNIGNVLYKMGEMAEANNALPQAISHLEKSAEAFKQAITLSTTDTDAKFNYELVKRKLEDLRQQYEQQQQKKQDNREEQRQEQESSAQPQQQNQEGQQQSPQKQEPEQQQAQQQQAEEQKAEQAQSQSAEKKEPGKMTKEDALRLLNALSDEQQQKQLQEYLRQRFKGSLDMERDW
ncbi:MAG: tetratricopeptide repeat protein [Candidatus Sumerlaeia bacterium]|nr:tetratricopeptide repeat protein [Candidatus Sumerlaeia bacterium]